LNKATAIALLPAAKGQRADAAVECGHPLLEDVGGGIHQPRVDPAHFLQGEQVGRMFAALEDVTGCLVDGDGARPGGGVWRLPGVQGERSQSACFGGLRIHGAILSV